MYFRCDLDLEGDGFRLLLLATSQSRISRVDLAQLNPVGNTHTNSRKRETNLTVLD